MSKHIKIVLFFLASVFLVACNQGHEPVLRLGTNIWIGYEPLYLAKEIKTIPEDEVRLVEYPSASEVIRAFRNGALEMASLTLDEALLLVQDQIPIRVILVHDISNGADVILSRPEIKSMKDIVGKRVAVESSALGAYVITRALEINQYSLKDITLKHLDVNDHEKAYENNEVDVVVNFEPVRTRLLNKGANEIFTSKEIYGEIVDVLVVHEAVYKKRLPTIKAMVNGWFEALKYVSEKPDAAAVSMAKRLKITPQEVIASFNGLELPGRDMNRKLLAGDRPELHGTIQKLSTVLKANQLLKKNINTANIISSDAL